MAGKARLKPDPAQAIHSEVVEAEGHLIDFKIHASLWAAGL